MTPVMQQAASGRQVVLHRHLGGGHPVVVLPAMGVPARWYEPMAGALAERGMAVTVIELPGQGDSPRRPAEEPHTGYSQLVHDELATALVDSADNHGGVPPVVVGHSLGGQVALLAAARGVEPMAGIALPATGTVHWRAYRTWRGLGILALTQTGALLARASGVHRGDRLGFGGIQPRHLFTEWADVARTGRWRLDGEPVDLRRVSVPVLSLTVPGDTYAPRPVADALLADLPAAAVTRRDLHAAAFSQPVDHLRWLRDPAPVAARIVDWIVSRLPTDTSNHAQEHR